MPHSPIVERLDHAPELHLSLNIVFKLGSTGGSGDGHLGGVGGDLRVSRHGE